MLLEAFCDAFKGLPYVVHRINCDTSQIDNTGFMLLVAFALLAILLLLAPNQREKVAVFLATFSQK